MARSKKGSLSSKNAFLEGLGETASVTMACKVTGLPRRTVYNWRETDPLFARNWDRALDMGTGALEDEAIRRALHGIEKPVFRGKEVVGYIQEFSDTLLIFMLKARRPELYRDKPVKPVEHTSAAEDLRQFFEAMQGHALPLGHKNPEPPEALVGIDLPGKKSVF